MPPELYVYLQSMDDFASSPEPVRDSYGVVRFYIMLMNGPVDEGLPWYAGKPKTALERLGATRQGIVVLHHAILAYPQWQTWSDITGIEDRGFGYHVGQTAASRVANPNHPIGRGIADWTMVDETYTMANAGPGSEVLLTYDHPRSMKTIAWTRQYRQSRVFCYQAGHDQQAWGDTGFREFLRRGILWSANALG
jgi:hypothetical protein